MAPRPAGDRAAARCGLSTPDPAEIIASAQREFTEMAPSMLKQKVVALVFLPWLTRYTGRLVEVAKEEERRAILAELASEKLSTGKREWRAGYEAAIESVCELISSRSESPDGAL